jgi:hypothetical protein
MDAETAARARDVVRPLAERLELAARLREFEPLRWHGRRDTVPVLHLEDVSGIPFVSLVPGVEEYQHRARVRAEDGDLFAAVTAPSEGYESYCATHLGLGSPEFVLADPVDHGYAVARACLGGAALERFVAVAREAGGLMIHPYMAIEEVWQLATIVAERAAVPVTVLGPPPPVLWIANDKSLLSEVVALVHSPEWIVETHASAEPAEMAAHLARLARQHGKVGLKRTRCASAMGNAVYDLSRIQRLASEQIVDEVRSFLERTEWACDEEVLIVAWEETDNSPSTQLWIPPLGQGLPVVHGVYEQMLEGEEKVFIGSRPSTLPAPVNATLSEASLAVAAALQGLGYVGRCSFDFIVLGDPGDEYRVKFTECNGRWGGTSTPMHLVDRLIPGPRPPYWAQDYMHHDLIGCDFPELLRRVGDRAYDPTTGRGRYIFYNVGPLPTHGKFDVIVLGESPEEAEEFVQRDLPRRLGLGAS